MTRRFEEVDLEAITTVPIESRRSKISVEQIVDPARLGGGSSEISATDLLESLPDVLAASSLKGLVAAMKKSKREGREIIWLVGAHTIKCGLSLYLNALIEAGYISAIATTGSSTIHDLELAFFGKTSEFVEDELPLGRFGMSAETAAHYSQACVHAWESELGMGEGFGDYVGRQQAPHRSVSVFHKAHAAGIPATVHVSFGTDITHQHPSFPAAKVGELTMRDFRVFTRKVQRAFDGGVVVLFGSAVILPEVFLKAVSINYNLGHRPSGVTAASFDMLPQYRVTENVLGRPFKGAGNAFAITGHHEIMLPLLYFLLSG